MNTKWIKKSDNESCILFFNGWGMDENVIKHLDSSNFDILMFFDYSALTINENIFSNYKKLYLVGWSLGVWVASYTFSKSKTQFQKTIAINGTLNPLSSEYGIPIDIFRNTLKNWNDKNKMRFYARIFGKNRSSILPKDKLPCRDIENQKNELQYLLNTIELHTTTNFLWDLAIIGNNDLIFSCENQTNYWNNKTEIKNYEMPHFPFLKYQSWNEIIKTSLN